MCDRGARSRCVEGWPGSPWPPPNKRMKLTRPERIGASQLIRAVSLGSSPLAPCGRLTLDQLIVVRPPLVPAPHSPRSGTSLALSAAQSGRPWYPLECRRSEPRKRPAAEPRKRVAGRGGGRVPGRAVCGTAGQGTSSDPEGPRGTSATPFAKQTCHLTGLFVCLRHTVAFREWME